MGDAVPRQSGIKNSYTPSSGLEADQTIKGKVNELSRLQGEDRIGVGAHFRSMQDVYRNHYLYQKGVLDDVILSIISRASNRPITERADSVLVRTYLRQELDTLGLDVPFEYAVVNHAGTVLYKSAGYTVGDNSRDGMFVQTLFPNDVAGPQNYLKVYFPTKKDYIFSSISFMVPAFAFTFILLIIFVFTIIVAFRQKKITEMKNDFINRKCFRCRCSIARRPP